jgi:alpha-tubulin suppressor-like RCC1 family protein
MPAALQLTPMKLERRDSLLDISCGDNFSVGLTEGGQLLFWGQDLFSNKVIWGPKPIKSDVKFKSVSAGRKHCAAISEDGMVYTWGTQVCIVVVPL